MNTRSTRPVLAEAGLLKLHKEEREKGASTVDFFALAASETGDSVCGQNASRQGVKEGLFGGHKIVPKCHSLGPPLRPFHQHPALKTTRPLSWWKKWQPDRD